MNLILLMIVTLLAVSTMRTATLELLTAGNAQHREKAFELAQAGIAAAVGQLNQNRLRLVSVDGWARPGAVTGNENRSGDGFRVDLRFLYRGAAPIPAPPGPAEAYFFELVSTGETGGRKARSIQTQGFWVSGINDRPINLSYWFPHEAP